MIMEVEILIIARVQATAKRLDLPRVFLRPATSVQSDTSCAIQSQRCFECIFMIKLP